MTAPGPTESATECDLTFFVPCLNEEVRVAFTLETLRTAMAQLPSSYEVIVVDDGSTDGTSRVVETFMAANPAMRIRLYRNPRNFGLARSFVDAAFLGRGRYFRLICGDNVEPSATIVAIVSRMGQADLIIPYYPSVPGKSAGRMTLSHFFTRVINGVSGYRLRYYNGNPLYRRTQVMRWAPHNYGFGYQADLITQLLDQGATFIEVAVSGRHAAKSGSSSLNFRNLTSVGHSLLEIALRRLRRRLFRH